ncbi:MAG: hypothetical protein WC865_18060 [Bacteroidales bacterium]
MNSILSHVITFGSGLLIGIFGNYFANRLSENAKNKDSKRIIKKTFQDIKLKMPELINEMKTDLKNPSMNLCREFFISTSKSVPFNLSSPAFKYYENEHENLRSKIRILENAGFVYDITEGKAPKFQFDEQFVDLLNNDK